MTSSEMTVIPEEISSLSFCLVRKNEKRPVEPGWQNKPHKVDDPELRRHLQEGGNYGVICGLQGLMVLDVDDMAAFAELVDINKLPATFKVQTGNKGLHYYYKVTGGDHRKVVLKNGNGDHLGELQGAGAMVVAPGSVHPNGNVYSVMMGWDITEIAGDDLFRILKSVMPPEEKLKKVATRRRAPTSTDDDPFAGVSILDVINVAGFTESGGQYFGKHPVHGSETGHNLVANPEKNSWWCGRHETGGGPALWVAVEEGIIDCSEARPGALTGKKFIETIEAAERRGLIEAKGKPTPPEEDVPEDVKARALEILEGGDPIEYVITQFHRFHVGDDKLAKVMLASVVSGSILNSAGIQPKLSGRSGAGKTHACKSLCHCLPPEIVVEASVSAKALFYLSDLQPGQVVFSDDIVMSEDLEGTLKRSMTNFQEGTTHITLDRNRQLQRLPLPPRLTWWLTSVNDHFSDELINRQYGLNVKEGRDTDRQVFSHSMTRATQAGEEFFVDEEVQVAREIIRQIRQNVYLVAVPFAERIGMVDVSDRRNPGRFLDLIRAATVARTMQRKAHSNGDGVVVVDASEADFAFAEELFADRASNLIRKVNNTEDDLLAFIAVRGPVSGSEIVRDFRLRDGRGLSTGYVHALLHGRKDRGGKGLLDRIEGLAWGKETIQTDEGKTVFQNVYTLHTVYNRWTSFDKAVWLEPDQICHGFATDLPNGKNEKSTSTAPISKTDLSDLSDLPKNGGAKSEAEESRSSEGKDDDLANLTNLTKASPLDSDSQICQPGKSDGKSGPDDGAEKRIFGLTFAYYRDLKRQHGGLSVKILMDTQSWDVERARMAYDLARKEGIV